MLACPDANLQLCGDYCDGRVRISDPDVETPVTVTFLPDVRACPKHNKSITELLELFRQAFAKEEAENDTAAAAMESAEEDEASRSAEAGRSAAGEEAQREKPSLTKEEMKQLARKLHKVGLRTRGRLILEVWARLT